MTAKRIVVSLVLAILPLQAFALTTDELLALVAMPLAVAAVSDISGVPVSELANVAATLNAANVAPVEFVEVMRYVPVALVVDVPDQPEFTQYVDSRYQQGVIGSALVTDIERQLPVYGIPAAEITVVADPWVPQTVIAPAFFPPVVQTRVAAWRDHPHGGPPGQLKKELGLQTGAEVVHGASRGRDIDRRDSDRDRGEARKADKRGRDRAAAAKRSDDHPKKAKQNEDRGRGNAGGNKGGGHGKGKG